MTSTAAFPLATADPYTGGDAGAGSANSGGGVDTDAGAAGGTSGAVELSHGALVAIIVVVVIVAVGGIASAVLFYLAKKREWKIRESIRRSAKKVVTALTPRRSEFPRSVKESTGRTSRGRVRLDDVPPTPRLRPEDVEKGLAFKPNIRHSPEGRNLRDKWARK
ncbi:hypothetical protein JX265_001018 [Neoarthrinium moseri]|uniref:Uncharacterized protein n=1 Tax=Neoarthrinium moseri TaxID=1658444 RepID=A0A9P9WX96_9PEZI|nr:uncharacterized protein JN550_004709 [Neoarthrinium moseri]KAI1846096.1 hypothetical protein JX266_007905 [Neoarthrinium moseri]KAI1871264.1 hypothetical protein JN550_004709 [Neoarthrinium moseri]KAI1880778.1 hypothetical protein JX265_001018 [Neoarthrinium moseri]